MPASICDPVSSALRLSLSNDDSQSSSLLDSRIYSSAKSVLLSKIEFEESGDYQSNVLDGLKSKYVVIRPKKPVLENKLLKKECSQGTQSSETKNAEDGLPRPKRVFFPVEKVQLGWQGVWSVGAGMQNVGNTCYLNSTLQALFHVPALANWLVTEVFHAEKCNQQEACVICGMRASLMATQKSGGSPVKPWQVYSKLRLICRHLTPGRQEDAHEFLRYLVEAMEKCYLQRFLNSDKLDQYSKETTPLNQILGGYLRSTVRCLACQHLSTTYQHFQDLLVDIRKHSTLDEALDSFFSRERLEDLGYKCEACNKKVSATKQFFIERAPMVLCIALKRFSLVGGKLSKHVQFRKKISLAKYMHNKNTQQQLSYKLVSMVTHLGPSQNCGHYTAIGQAPNGSYYQFDDSCVRPLPLSAVLGTNAYIMFFEKDSTEDICTASTSSTVYGPQLPSNFLNREKSPMKREKSPVKLTFYRSDERKPLPAEASFKDNTEKKTEVKQPVILNSTLSKPEASSSNSEPWVVKQNGEVEKVTNISKFLNGIINKEEEKKNSFVLKRPSDENSKKLGKSDAETKPVAGSSCQKSPEKILTGSKLVKPLKSPLEKLKEQMTKNGEIDSAQQRNGNGTSSKLVPYDSESSGDERSDTDKGRKENGISNNGRVKPARSLVVATTSSQHAWTVSSENNTPLLSPSLNGDTNKKLNKEESPVNGNSPNTSVSTLSPISADWPTERRSAERIPLPPAASGAPPLLSAPATLRTLHTLSHRGYGAPVHTWAGTHSQINKQVMEERREERKRAHEDIDDMDRGRVKKVKKFHHYNRYNNDRNGYNPFQDKQNKQNWGGGGAQFGFRDRRPPRFHHKNYNNKYKRFNNRYNNNNGHHYPRHH